MLLFTNEGDGRIRTRATLRQTISPEVWDAETGESLMPLELSLGDESVRVTNTRANQLTDEKLPSGLFGEVRITR